MKKLTFIIVLVMEFFYAVWIISDWLGENWKWSAFLFAAAVCGVSMAFVRIYCCLRTVVDTKAVMKSGTVLVFGIKIGAVLLYYIAEHWGRLT